MKEAEVFDVTIIGGGPAGLFSSFYSGLREMKTKIIEYQNQLGGKVHVYPEKLIWDVGGIPPISGEKLIEQLVEQALTFQPTVVLGEKVSEITKNEAGLFVLKTESGEKHYSRAVIVAIGGGIINPQKLEVEGAENFFSSNLNYTIKSLKKFKDKVVVISGGGHTAVDWANELEPIAKKVYLTYRKDTLNAHEAQVSQLLNSSVQCFFYTEITKLIPDGTGTIIEKVELTNNQTGEVTTLPVDEVVVNHGYKREQSLLEESKLNIEMVNEYFMKGNVFCETSVPGLYAAGDVIHYEGKVHLIAGAFQDAINAVNKAKLYIQPEADESGIVSSHNDIFQKRNRELINKQLQEQVVVK
ncbi:NAD(P)/FAD-dependent oxidoreductase [Aliibacillus thermotolerans]|uniref:Ferredoxin--NADP reductase n=1 Tax=Aliibacillus thermotolerans TaxID=1834418 RepID=A0ABW0U4E6_9BACI|nr:NAD(P)/FAD-dependent oxidoreductase [Aliibacillus thermotolerans]MDA3129433.1 SidA/IucD/PvdA family monooxygenase [Aliibacillus thermotolerans]